ncbi:MAG TPA: PAS domain-containing sensor histidine kinase [Syntrophorhabdaceae bacterium]|nr:PAS domain-containing sensor histidine kinase [Syntrophorhabdaceae bacterium]
MDNDDKPINNQSLLSAPHIHKMIIDNLPIGFTLLDKNGNIHDFNQVAEELTGYKKDEVIGRPHFEIIHGSVDKGSCPIFRAIFDKHTPSVAIETELKRKNGSRIDVVVVAFPLFDISGEFIGGAELFRDITEIKRLEKERKNLLSMFAHDMKNPIVAAEGFLMRLLAEKAGPLTEKQRDYVDIIERATKKLKRLITDFLDFSRFDRKEYKPILTRYNIEEAIKKQIEMIKIEAEKKGIQISFEYKKGDSFIIPADAEMIDRVLSNLIDNAIKYTKEGGRVIVRASSDAGNTIVEVSDTGIGIHEKDLSYIFDAFHRINRDGEGSGLGLSIARAIIEAHHGIISVESQPGKGSRFWFSIPKNLDVLMDTARV